MNYTEQVLDRSTGELIEVSTGDWITLTELGELKGVTARRIRTILREMDFLYVSGGKAHNRHRLSPWVVQAGYGKHVPASRGKVRFPFDVISPSGREWIEERWSKALTSLQASSTRLIVAQAREALSSFQAGRLTDLNVHGSALWLSDHFADLTHHEIGSILDVSQQVISRYLSLRTRQQSALRERQQRITPDLGRLPTLLAGDEWSYASGGARYITQAHNLPKPSPVALA